METGLNFNEGFFTFDDEGPHRIFGKGDAVPAGGAIHWEWFRYELNQAGQAALSVRNKIDDFTFYSSIFRMKPDRSLITLAEEGMALGEDGTTLATFKVPVLNDLGEAAFVARIDGSSAGVHQGIFLTDGTNIPLLARRNRSTPTGNATFTVLRSPVLNNQGLVAFVAEAGNASGIYFGTKDAVTLVYDRDDADGTFVPTSGSTPYGRAVVLNDLGQAAFVGQFRYPRVPGLGTTTDKRIVFRDQNGGLYQIARQGFALEGSPIKDVGLFGDDTLDK